MKMNRLVHKVLVLVLGVSAGFGALAHSSGAQKKDGSAPTLKKLIEVGWDAPTPDVLRANLAAIEKQPFDGTMVNLRAGKTFLNKVPYPDSAYESDRKDLAAVANAKVLNQNFLTVWSAREAGWDWFNDSDWAAATTNIKNFAKLAQIGKMRGFIFDPEPYGTNPWTYSAELYPSQTFVSVQSKVKERGASFMKTAQQEMPTIRILTLFNASIVESQVLERKGKREEAEWILLASFIDGMLSTIGPKAQIIDGNEVSYYFLQQKDFADYRAEKRSARTVISAANRDTYDRRVSIAHAVFADGTLNLLNSPRFFGFYLKTDQQRLDLLEANLFHAMKSSDEYVWVYNEQMNWWGSNKQAPYQPPGLADVLRRVKAKVNDSKPLTVSLEPFLSEATTRFKAKVEIFGRVSTKGLGEAGTGLGGVALQSGFTLNGGDTACQVSRDDGYYACTVPPGWSGRITPMLDKRNFQPPFVEVNTAKETVYNANFEAK
jgi:hypothetical protein